MTALRSDRRRPSAAARLAGLLAGVLVGGLVGCGGTSAPNAGTDGADSPVLSKPDGGGLFLLDPSRGGEASEFRIEEMYYGRLVEVYERCTLTEDGTEVETFRFADFVIGEDVATDGVNYEVATNPVTQRTRLTILTEYDGPVADFSAELPCEGFFPLLRAAEDATRPLAAKDPNGLPPFPFVARNSTVVLRFSDALSPLTIDSSTVQVLNGNPPIDPFEARVLPDPNHGILATTSTGQPGYFPTRILVDMTVSELEAEESSSTLTPNSLGLPASPTSNQANIAVRIPSRVDFASGQFSNLQNVTGHPISVDEAANGPIDTSVPTVSVVRGLRSGSESDVNNGFLRDLEPPRVIGEQTLAVTSAVADTSAGAQGGIDFVVDLSFTSATCALRPRVGDILNLSSGFFGVTAAGAAPIAGQVSGVRVSSQQAAPTEASTLVGSGSFLSTFDPAEGDRPECFVAFIPRPQLPPTAGVDPGTQIRVRFSEPMDPASVTAFDTFMVTRETEGILPTEVHVASILPSADLQTFTTVPTLDMRHVQGTSEGYFFATGIGSEEIVDLAGNALRDVLPPIEFTLRPQAETRDTGSYVLRFSERDEDGNATVDLEGNVLVTRPEIRGQFLYNLDRGIIRPRPVSRFLAVADRTHPVTSLMNPFPPGVQTPLSPLGSRLMTVWRYCDFNFALTDESLYNLDVEGVSWAPKNGQVVADTYEEFRIRFSHSNRQPDEFLGPTSNLPDYPDSGLAKGQFESVSPNGNLLIDPFNELTVVHAKEKGYQVNPADVFTSESGTKLMPFPLNDDVPAADRTHYTWRDTRILARGAPEGNGVNLKVLESAGLIPGDADSIHTAGRVPSIGLPLLMEYSCYPSDTGVGLNSFDVSLAINSSGQPNFRLFATGGVNSTGEPVSKDPDLSNKATGGFNPSAGGEKTRGFDVVFYHGALDIVVRISRATTIWIDGREPSVEKDWGDPLIEPPTESQPLGTQVRLAFRGAVQGSWVQGGPDDLSVLDANTYNPYGDPVDNSGGSWGQLDSSLGYYSADLFTDEATWYDSIHTLDGANYIQVRITFVGNPVSGLTPELSALAIPYQRL